VTWSATGGNINSNGVFTATSAGSAMITATSVQDQTKFGAATVAVAVPITITSVTVVCTPSSIFTNGTSSCSPNVVGTGNYNSAVSWSATGGSINQAGLFTPSGVGNAKITATSVQDVSKSGSTSVSVAVPITITSVTVACNPASILTTGTSTCSANVAGAGSYNSAVTWSATGGTITQAGVFTPTGAGNALITATSVQDSTKSNSANVAVAVPITITSVTVACNPPSIPTTGTSTCSANVAGTGSYNSAVTWSATGGTITQAGVFTPNGAGNATITATSDQDSSKLGSTAVSVSLPPTIISVSPSCIPNAIYTSQTSKCTANLTGTGIYDSSVTWSVDNGTIDQSGSYTAPVTPGTANIKAVSTEDPTEFGTTSITVTTAPTITSVTVSCNKYSIPVGQSTPCTDTVQGTGAFSQDVLWEVNGVEGGNQVYGTISPTGLYQAPSTVPSAYIVTISAVSTEDSSKSASTTVLIAGTINSSTVTIGPAGGTITLPDTSSVTIPADVLQAPIAVTLASSSIAIQPTNPLFQGLGPSLSLSFDPALSASSLAQRSHRLAQHAKPLDSSTPSPITFVVNGDPASTPAQIQSAFGVFDVNDGGDNYFSVPSAYDPSLNQTVLTVDPSLIEANSTYQAGLAFLPEGTISLNGAAKLQQWDPSQNKFIDVPSGSCASGAKSLVMMHGMLSCPNGTFSGGADPAAPAAFGDHNLNYDSVLAIDYSWWLPVDNSAQAVASILNKAFTCQPNPTFDIEADSLGVVVSMASIEYLNPATLRELRHFVSVAGPINGTPIANLDKDLISAFLNWKRNDQGSCGSDWLLPSSQKDITAFVGDLKPGNGSNEISIAQSAASKAPNAIFDAFAGNQGYVSGVLGQWYSQHVFDGAPNDGVVPVSSALAQGITPHFSPHGPYGFDHQDLIDHLPVVQDILTALEGNSSGSGGYTLSANPSSFNNVTAGSGGNFQLTATSTNGFSGSVAVTTPFSIGGVTGSCTEPSVSINPQTSGIFDCSFSTAPSTSTGSYQLNITTTSGSLTPVPANVTVNVVAQSGQPGYTVNFSGSGQTITAGNSATFTLTATSTNNFVGNVNVQPPTINIPGATSYWSASSISVTPSNPGTSTLTVNTSANTPAGPYTITEIMPNGLSPSVQLNVNPPQQAQPPTAHFTMSYQNQTATENQILNITAPPSGDIVVNLQSTSIQGSAPITSSIWTSSGNLICPNSTPTCSLTLTNAAHNLDVTLTLTDQNGKNAQAVGHVVVTVQQPITPTLTGFTISPAPAVSGAYVTLSFTLSGPAPQGGATISLQTNNAGVPLPPTFTILGGQPSGGFSVQTNSTLSQTTITTVTAIYNGSSQTFYLQVTVPGPVISSVSSPVPASASNLEPVTITGTNLPTAAAGGYLVFYDTNQTPYYSYNHPDRIALSSANQWIYNMDNNNDKGTWHVQIFTSTGQSSFKVPFQVQ
jgi:hypothetical protein